MNDTIRRKRDGILSESVQRWHGGPGSPGGRWYEILYTENRIRIDVGGPWSSVYHTLWLSPEELRPAEEWLAHTGGTAAAPLEFCGTCGREIPGGAAHCPDYDDDHRINYGP